MQFVLNWLRPTVINWGINVSRQLLAGQERDERNETPKLWLATSFRLRWLQQFRVLGWWALEAHKRDLDKRGEAEYGKPTSAGKTHAGS